MPEFLQTLFNSQNIAILTHVTAALVAGGIIGLERSFHGRPAGFRTHTLVCFASSLLMIVTVYQSSWLPPGVSDEIMHADPTRIAQGIMTGIGFLGAGVIYKDGNTVRGLTTAASIWITAAIGVLVGAGLYFPAALGVIFTLGVLSTFHKIERAMPKNSYINHHISFSKHNFMPEADLRTMIEGHGFDVGNVSYHGTDKGDVFEYRMTIRTKNTDAIGAYAAFLTTHKAVHEFKITPSGD